MTTFQKILAGLLVLALAASALLHTGLARWAFFELFAYVKGYDGGAGNRSVAWGMAGNSMLNVHISEMPARHYKKAHRHASDAFILILAGKGFSLIWPEGAYHKRERIDWQPGTLFVPPTFWYHHHLNLSAEPASYLAIHPPKLVRNLGLRFADQLEVDLDEARGEWWRALHEDGSQTVPPT